MSYRRKKKLRPAEIMTINLAVCDLGISGNMTLLFLLCGVKTLVILNHSLAQSSILSPPTSFLPSQSIFAVFVDSQ